MSEKLFLGSAGPFGAEVRVLEFDCGAVRIRDLPKLITYCREKASGFGWGCYSSSVEHLAGSLFLDLTGKAASDWVIAEMQKRWLSKIPFRATWTISGRMLWEFLGTIGALAEDPKMPGKQGFPPVNESYERLIGDDPDDDRG